MSGQFRVKESTEPKIRITPSTEPHISVEQVIQALGAEPAGPAPEKSGTTFADLRARAAWLIADSQRGDSVPIDSELRKTLQQLSNDLRAEGIRFSPNQLAAALLKLSTSNVDDERKKQLRSMQSTTNLEVGQST